MSRLYKVRISLLEIPKTGHERLPDLNVNESQALTLGCFSQCKVKIESCSKKDSEKRTSICGKTCQISLSEQTEMCRSIFSVQDAVGSLRD